MARSALGGYLAPYPTGYLMPPLKQLNLKIPEAVRSYWQAQAAAAGLSIRDWLVRQTLPGGEREVSPGIPAAPSLEDRLAALEAKVGELASSAALSPPPSGPRRSPPAPPGRANPAPASGAVESRELARLLKMKPGSLNARVSRAGGPVPGLTIGGWTCLGLFPAPRGGPPRAHWAPPPGLVPDPLPDQVPDASDAGPSGT